MTPFAHALVAAAPDRLVWGSDWPHVLLEKTMPNDGDLVDQIAVWVPDEETRRRTPICAGPILEVRKPKLALPPKAADCHCHVFGPRGQISLGRRTASIRRRRCIWRIISRCFAPRASRAA